MIVAHIWTVYGFLKLYNLWNFSQYCNGIYWPSRKPDVIRYPTSSTMHSFKKIRGLDESLKSVNWFFVYQGISDIYIQLLSKVLKRIKCTILGIYRKWRDWRQKLAYNSLLLPKNYYITWIIQNYYPLENGLKG